MIFVFDWGYTTEKQVGPLTYEDARYQLKADMVWLVRVRYWFRAFFIPTIPTRTRYFFVSTTNNAVREGISKETFMRHRALAELNARMMDGEIDDEAYHRARSEMGR